MATATLRNRPVKFVPPVQKTANYNPKFERSQTMGDDILQLIDESELSAVDNILKNKMIDIDMEEADKETLKKIEELPSIADIVNEIGKEKFFALSGEDRELLFADPVGSGKYEESEFNDTSEAHLSSEIRKNFKELGM